MKRKRVWAASPVFYVLAALLFVMAGVNWFQGNDVLFYVELAAAVLAVAAVAITAERFRLYVASAVKSARSVLGVEEYENLKDFTMPVAVIGEAGDILWVNDAFLTSVSPGRELRGENVSKLIYPKNMQQLLEAGGSDLSLEDRQFTVFAAKTEHGFVLYFIDDTYYKEINREFEETRPIVALAYFDNREELARDTVERCRPASPRRWSLLSTSGRTPWAASASAFPAGGISSSRMKATSASPWKSGLRCSTPCAASKAAATAAPPSPWAWRAVRPPCRRRSPGRAPRWIWRLAAAAIRWP